MAAKTKAKPKAKPKAAPTAAPKAPSQAGHAKALADSIFGHIREYVGGREASILKRVELLEKALKESETLVDAAYRRSENADLGLAACQRMLCTITGAKNLTQLRQQLAKVD